VKGDAVTLEAGKITDRIGMKHRKDGGTELTLSRNDGEKLSLKPL
jgi:hypothetical protein